MTNDKACINTDKELWREVEGDYYAPSVHVTADGLLGINVGGQVYAKPLIIWHDLVLEIEELRKQKNMLYKENERLLHEKVKYKGAFEALFEKVSK